MSRLSNRSTVLLVAYSKLHSPLISLRLKDVCRKSILNFNENLILHRRRITLKIYARPYDKKKERSVYSYEDEV